MPQWLDMPSDAFVVGAGAAPNHVIGVLGEVSQLNILNISLKNNIFQDCIQPIGNNDG